MSSFIAQNRVLQAEMLAGVDRFVVLTERARQVVVANDGAGAPVALNRLGIRAETGQGGPREAVATRREHVTVAYLGRFDRIKGVHDLARAVRALGNEARVRVEFRGPISNLHELHVTNELKAIVGPDAWVRFLPPVGPDEVFAYLREVDVLCCPSIALEGGPTVALEAMAVGTPVVATRMGALAELIEDGVSGRLVPPGDWRALAAALRAIAADPAGTLDRWRAHLPAVRTMDDVVQDYLRMYAG
jgi:glycosyltransferase involved in cell wall biosynthesis